MGFKSKEDALHYRRIELIEEIKVFCDHIQDLTDELLYRTDPNHYIASASIEDDQ